MCSAGYLVVVIHYEGGIDNKSSNTTYCFCYSMLEIEIEVRLKCRSQEGVTVNAASAGRGGAVKVSVHEALVFLLLPGWPLPPYQAELRNLLNTLTYLDKSAQCSLLTGLLWSLGRGEEQLC